MLLDTVSTSMALFCRGSAHTVGVPCFCAHLSSRSFESSYSTSTELPSDVAVTTSTSRESINALLTPIFWRVALNSCAHHSSPCPTTKSEKASVTIPAAGQENECQRAALLSLLDGYLCDILTWHCRNKTCNLHTNDSSNIEKKLLCCLDRNERHTHSMHKRKNHGTT